MPAGGLRVGVDVGGTFTKAVAVGLRPLALRASAVVPTTHDARAGVTQGVAGALRALLAELGDDRDQVDLVAFSTTTAMNALLEGDVALVGVIGIGAEPELRPARRRTAIGTLKLAPGHVLRTEHEFLDVTRGVDPDEVDRAIERLAAAGCASLAVSGAFAVDAPQAEEFVRDRARELGLPACAGSELTGAYGLETRTISAAINASILPVVERAAGVVERVLHEAGIDVPLLVLRGDGGSMSLEAFRRAPSFTIGSGPAAGVAAALHQLTLQEGIVLECGGTSSNVSVVRGGRTAMRTLRVMGRPTSIRSVDSWVVGAAGGSMARLGRRRIEETGPRSAHVAGLSYACFAPLAELDGATLDLIAPRPGDPEAYAVVRSRSGEHYALTATCAAHALGVAGGAVVPAGHDAAASALAGFAALTPRLRAATPEAAARMLLDGAVEKIARAVDEAARAHGLPRAVPVIALGGAGPALAPEVARVLGRPIVRPDHPEVLSSIGAALSLVRAEASRNASGPTDTVVAARAAERACVEAGAAPQTVTVETTYDSRERLVRAVATGAVALESGAAGREPVSEGRRLEAAARALGTTGGALRLLAGNEYYRVYGEGGAGPLAVVDGVGSVPLVEPAAKRIVTGAASDLLGPLREAVHEGAVNLGVAELLPRVAIVCGARIADLSDARRVEEILEAAESLLAGQEGDAVAVVRGS